ncbi:hypothetical protein PYCC9005_003323 [Savitreella phatthalungensis]
MPSNSAAPAAYSSNALAECLATPVRGSYTDDGAPFCVVKLPTIEIARLCCMFEPTPVADLYNQHLFAVDLIGARKGDSAPLIHSMVDPLASLSPSDILDIYSDSACGYVCPRTNEVALRACLLLTWPEFSAYEASKDDAHEHSFYNFTTTSSMSIADATSSTTVPSPTTAALQISCFDASGTDITNHQRVNGLSSGPPADSVDQSCSFFLAEQMSQTAAAASSAPGSATSRDGAAPVAQKAIATNSPQRNEKLSHIGGDRQNKNAAAVVQQKGYVLTTLKTGGQIFQFGQHRNDHDNDADDKPPAPY